MLRATLTILALSLAATAAVAADLPARSRIGAIFAEPEVVVVVTPLPPVGPLFVFAPEVDIPPLVAGYYGKPNSYLHRPYYGDTPSPFARLPYACGFHGYC